MDKLKNILADLLVLLGVILIVVGAFRLHPVVGFVCAGVACVYLGIVMATPVPRNGGRHDR